MDWIVNVTPLRTYGWTGLEVGNTSAASTAPRLSPSR
jgi:hypothetical protein